MSGSTLRQHRRPAQWPVQSFLLRRCQSRARSHRPQRQGRRGTRGQSTICSGSCPNLIAASALRARAKWRLLECHSGFVRAFRPGSLIFQGPAGDAEALGGLSPTGERPCQRSRSSSTIPSRAVRALSVTAPASTLIAVDASVAVPAATSAATLIGVSLGSGALADVSTPGRSFLRAAAAAISTSERMSRPSCEVIIEASAAAQLCVCSDLRRGCDFDAERF